MPDLGRLHDVSTLTSRQLERTRRDPGQPSTSPEPFDPRAWVRVTRAITARIDSGELQPAGPAPTLAALARDVGVSRDTVARAYRELAAQDILRQVPGHGYHLTPPGDRHPRSQDQPAPGPQTTASDLRDLW